MDTIGLALHKRESQLCIGRDDGTVEERRIVTSRERFAALLGDRAPARILLEGSTEREWVARSIEQLGHHAMWRNGQPYQAAKLRAPRPSMLRLA